MCLFKTKNTVTQKQVTKQEAGIFFTLFHYIMEMLYPCSEVKNPYKGFTSCRDTAHAGSESNLNSKLLHDLEQHWFDSWREKRLPVLLQIEISMFA